MTHNDLRYEFGPYQLNPSKRILTRDGEGIPLTPKATEILLVLVKHAGQLVETIARRGHRFTISVDNHDSEDFAESDDRAAKRPLIVVLPFDNNTGDIELDYYAPMQCWSQILTCAELGLRTISNWWISPEAGFRAVKRSGF